MVRSLATKILRRSVYGVGGVSLAGTAAVAVYTSTEKDWDSNESLRFGVRLLL
jgi:hypothetical protein